jgi:hypothetical protein
VKTKASAPIAGMAYVIFSSVIIVVGEGLLIENDRKSSNMIDCNLYSKDEFLTGNFKIRLLLQPCQQSLNWLN